MRETLLIRLSEGEQVTWRTWGGSAGEPRSSSGTLDDAIAECEGRRVLLLVPGTDVVLWKASVPGLRGQKLRQALPYSLEDDLAQDVESLHFSIGSATREGERNVAVVSRQHMDEWLAPLHERGIEPDAVYPEMLGVPWAETEYENWAILLDGERVLARTGPESGFACETSTFRDLMMLESLPENLHLTLYARSREQAQVTELCAGFPDDVIRKKQYWNTLATLAEGLDSHAIDLRQGAYAIRRGWQRWGLPFRATAILVVVFFLLQMALLSASHVQLSDQAQTLHARAVQTYKKMFPSDTRIVDMRAQTQEHLSELSQSGSSDIGLLSLLGKTSRALRATPNLTVTSLDYQNGVLLVGLHGHDLNVLSKLRSKFSELQGITLDVQSANAGENGVTVRLRIGASS